MLEVYAKAAINHSPFLNSQPALSDYLGLYTIMFFSKKSWSSYKNIQKITDDASATYCV